MDFPPPPPPTPGPPPPADGLPGPPPKPTRPKVFSNETVKISYDHALSRWGLTDFVICGVLFVGVSIAVIFLLSLFIDNVGVPTGPWLILAVGIPPLTELLYVVWAGRAKGQGVAADFRLSFKQDDLTLGLSLFGLAIISAAAIVAVWSIFGEPPTAAATDLAEDSSDSLTVWIVLFAVLGATFVPVVEELVFRGLLWSALEKRGHGHLFVLIMTSAVFSLFHFEPTRAPILFVIGIALGLGRLRTGRIGASIATHVFINSFAMIGLLTAFGEST